jgi:hypothetical protein
MADRRIIELMASPPEVHDLVWLKEALAAAIRLEFATIPPYLCAMWSVEPYSYAWETIRSVVVEEMLHMGLAANLLTAVGGTVNMNGQEAVPRYPGPLPGGVHPGLEVALEGLSTAQLDVFLAIEYPEGGPIAIAREETFTSIGAFYGAILAAFESLSPALSADRQIAQLSSGLFKVLSLDHVRMAIDLIKRQGEGSAVTPEENPDDLAHYYRFKELAVGRKLVRDTATGQWGFTGEPIPLSVLHPMARVPAGGYQQSAVSDPVAWERIVRFDQDFTAMLNDLQAAWSGLPNKLEPAVGAMYGLSSIATDLMQFHLPQGGGRYGPCFRLVEAG